jgi:hypothetical protein
MFLLYQHLKFSGIEFKWNDFRHLLTNLHIQLPFIINAGI